MRYDKRKMQGHNGVLQSRVEYSEKVKGGKLPPLFNLRKTVLQTRSTLSPAYTLHRSGPFLLSSLRR